MFLSKLETGECENLRRIIFFHYSSKNQVQMRKAVVLAEVLKNNDQINQEQEL